MGKLTFDTLRKANLARLPLFKNAKGELAHNEPTGCDWSPAQWLQAMVGEYANFRKKFERGDITHQEFMAHAWRELADVQIYLDLLAARLGIDLDAAVAGKFNEVSDRIGVGIYIDGNSVYAPARD